MAPMNSPKSSSMSNHVETLKVWYVFFVALFKTQESTRRLFVTYYLSPRSML